MKIKRFSARDLPTVMNMIKEEFGLRAIILSQRESQDSGVEVTAGVKDEDLPDASSSARTETFTEARSRPKAGSLQGLKAYQRNEPAAASASASVEEIQGSVERWGERLTREVSELRNLVLDLAHRQSLAEQWRNRPELVGLYRRLLNAGWAPEYARPLVERAAESAQTWGGELRDHLQKTLQPRLKIVDLTVDPPRYLAVVGPSGGGKTSALVNLAAFYRQRGRRTAIISLDTIRLGAAEQLTQYARIMGLPLKICQNLDEFNEAREIFEGEEQVLIDTPARSFFKSEGRKELEEYLNAAGVSVLLTLPAGLKDVDFAAALGQVEPWPLAGLVITKFDETENLGGFMGFIMSRTPPLAFLSLGPKTPEDFRPASIDEVLRLLRGSVEENQR